VIDRSALQQAVAGLKFNAALPQRLATATLAARLADLDGACSALSERVGFLKEG